MNAISEPLRKPAKKVAQVEPAGFSTSSLLEALTEQPLRGVSEKVVKDARMLLLPPATHRAPWDDGMEIDDDPERIKERKARKNLVMKVLNATMGSLASVQKAGWRAGGEIYSEENIRNVAAICKNALTAFRYISKEENDKSAMVEGEKAALNIVGKLMQMQLVSDLPQRNTIVPQLTTSQHGSSWDLLHDTHSSLPTLYSHSSLSTSSPLPDALRLPLPHSTSLLDATLAGLSLAHLSYALQCALHLSPDEALPALHDPHLNNGLFLSWVPHFATASKAQVKLVCVSLYKTIESLTQSPPLSSAATAMSNSPSARFTLRSYALLTLLHGASVDAVELEADWDIKQAANIAAAYHKSEEEAGERAVAQRIHEFFVCVQKATDAKRKGEAKAWTQLKTFWVAVVSRARYAEGLEYLARVDSVPVPLSPKIGNNQTGRQEIEGTGGWATPLQAAAKLSAAAAYIDDAVWNARDGQVVERLEGYIGGLPSASLTASSREECEQLQRGADRLRRAVGKALPSAEGRVATLLRELLECTVDVYEGLLKVRTWFQVYSSFTSDALLW